MESVKKFFINGSTYVSWGVLVALLLGAMTFAGDEREQTMDIEALQKQANDHVPREVLETKFDNIDNHLLDIKEAIKELKQQNEKINNKIDDLRK